MAMATKDMQLELLALHRLYGLLNTDGDAMSNRISDVLDDNARGHLKKLLDESTQRTLKAHAEIVGRVEAPNPGIAPVINESYGTVKSYEQKKPLSALDASKEKGFSELPAFQSGTTSGLEKRKKRCRVCKSTVKQYFTSIEQPNFQDQSLLNSELEIGSPSIDTAVNSNSEKGMQMVPEANSNAQNSDVDYRERPEMLNESSDAIQEIGLCISTLHLLDQRSWAQPPNFMPAGIVPPIELNENAQSNMFCKFASQCIEEPSPTQAFVPAQPTNSMLQSSTSQFIRNRGQDLGLKVSDEKFGKLIEEPKLPYQKTNQNVKAMIERIESRKWKEDQNELPNTIRRTPQPHKLGIDGNIDPINVKANRRSNRKGKTLPKTLHGNEVPKSSKYESASSSSRSYASNNSVTGEYSSPYQSQTTKSYSATSLSDGTQSESNSVSNSSEDKVYSSTNDDEASEATPSINTSTSDTQPIQRQVRSKYASTSTRAGPSRIHDSGYESTSMTARPRRILKSGYNTDRKRKTRGTWSMLKDKLGVFFHHHHHHHHNLENDQARKKSKSKISLLSKRDAEDYAEKGVEKMMKSDKNHHMLQGLVGTALKHVRRSKKPRTDEKVRTLDKHHGGKKTGLKTSNWLKVLKHHRKAELAKKKHEKQRKSHLKTLHTMK